MNNQEISIQTILYNHDIESIDRWLETVCNSIDTANKSHSKQYLFSIYMGDCSSTELITNTDIERIKNSYPQLDNFEYVFFDGNLGSAKGHNTLSKRSQSQFLMTVNPDTVMAPNCLAELISLMEDENTGIGEAIQIPLEHPKDFDIETGETGWASTCCAIIRRTVFDRVGGFDDEHFFLHCDDVDFSWAVRLANFKVRINPKAIIFHEHGFDEENQYVSTAAERRYSAIGALMLFAKYGRKDLLDLAIDHFEEHADDYQLVLQDWKSHELAGTIPEKVPNAESVAEFIDGGYAVHRW